jgi:RNA-binding protein YlmH
MPKKIVNQEPNIRLDKYLTKALQAEHGFSRAYVQKMIEQGLVLVNGQIGHAS